MFENKIVDVILDRLPKRYWNRFSRFLAFFSLRTIGSPIQFKCRGLTLKEYDLKKVDTETLEKFLRFCYPADEMSDREREIEVDKKYWPSTSTFVITRDSDSRVVGCIQFVRKTKETKLPVEYSHVVADSQPCSLDAGITGIVPKGSFAEIYRCRRASDLSGPEAVAVVSMLFKAIWTEVVNSSMENSVITFDARDNRLYNLYTRRLNFKDTGISVCYEGSPDEWRVLHHDWVESESGFAALSKSHFYNMTNFRTNLKKRRLKAIPLTVGSQPMITEEDTLLFADVKTARSIRHGKEIQREAAEKVA